MSFPVYQDPLTPEKLAETLKKWDEIIRPKALILNPQLKAALLKEYPEIEHKVVLVEFDACEKGSAYLMDRSEVEKYLRQQREASI